MPMPSPELQRALDRFGRQRGVTPEMVANLRTAITESPLLVEQMNLAVAERHWKGFNLLAPGEVAGATYDRAGKTIQLPLDKIANVDTRGRSYDVADMTFVLGHEVQHGFNSAQRSREEQAATREVRAIAQSPDPRDDMTDPVLHWDQAGREDEAKAHIAGWNALLSRVKAMNPDAGLVDVWKSNKGRTSTFLEVDKSGEVVTPKPGLTFNPDHSLSPTRENIDAMGQYYYDNVANSIGKAKSAYPDYNGPSIISQAVQAHRQYAKPHDGQEPQFVLDMQRLNMQEDKLETNGLDFGRSAAKQPRQPYYDSSHGMMTPGQLDHTINGPNVHRHVPVSGATQPIAFDPRHPNHPDHALHNTVRERIGALHGEHGIRLDDRQLEAMTANVMLDMRKAGVRQVGEVRFSVHPDQTPNPDGNLLVREPDRTPFPRFSATPVGQALQAPAEQNYQKMEDVTRQQAQDQAQWVEQQRQINERGPGMSLGGR